MKIILAFLLCFQLLHSKEHRLLIVGCPASGTTYTTQVLQRSGLDIKHEMMGKDGIVSWTMITNRIAIYNPTIINDLEGKFDHIFHQIRDPLRVIRNNYSPDNMKHLDGFYWSYIRSVIPQMKKEDSLLVHCAKFYYYWNLKAEEMAEFSYRIEDFESILPEFEERLGHPIDRSILSQVSTKTNSWETWNPGVYVDITWERLQKKLPPDLYRKLRGLAKRYGYVED